VLTSGRICGIVRFMHIKRCKFWCASWQTIRHWLTFWRTVCYGQKPLKSWHIIHFSLVVVGAMVLEHLSSAVSGRLETKPKSSCLCKARCCLLITVRNSEFRKAHWHEPGFASYFSDRWLYFLRVLSVDRYQTPNVREAGWRPKVR